MGFSKAAHEKEVTIIATHPFCPGVQFEFDLPKRMPQAAIDAERHMLGLPETARGDAHRLALIEVIGKLLLREPRGFDDFPEKEVLNARGDDLSFRARSYFDDPDVPELEQILVMVWRAYRQMNLPSAYLKSVQAVSAGNGDAPRAAKEAQPQL